MPKLLLVDTNLLLIAIIAAVDPSQVERIGRTRAYTLTDAALLDEIVADHDQVLVTPHILTEVSNLLGHLAQPLLSLIRGQLAALVPTWSERTEASADLVRDPFFLRFGLTDTAIARATNSNVTILTDDLVLYDALGRQGHRVINFTHVRENTWRQTIGWPVI